MSVPISDAAKAAIYAPETDEVFIILITIDHVDLSAPIRVCSDREDLTHAGDLYVAYPFEITLPESSGATFINAKIAIDNVDREIVKTVRSISSAASFDIKIVMASSPEVIELHLPDYQMIHVGYDVLKVTGDLSLENFLDEPYPGDSFTPGLAPGLF